VVGREPSAEQREVIEGAAASMDAGIAALAPGVSGSGLFAFVRGELVRRGLAEGPQEAGEGGGFEGYDCHGHGFGLAWEWPWITPWETRTVEPYTAMAIECMAGTEGVGLVKFEQNAIVSHEGPELLLELPALPTLETF
jgi:Xaa-Pro aminopeptidase